MFYHSGADGRTAGRIISLCLRGRGGDNNNETSHTTEQDHVENGENNPLSMFGVTGMR